jgi:hypothetical protein
LIQIKVARRRSYLLAFGQAFARRSSMMDVTMIAIGVVFFALSIGYVYACDRL